MTLENTDRVIVTAGASGIGLAIARGFAAAGARVHICDLDGRALEVALSQSPELSGTLADVSKPTDLDKTFADALAQFGGVDVLVNNAGVGGPRALIEDTEEAAWEACLAVNLSGAFYAIKRAVPLMKAQRSGVILNISTSSARTGLPLRSAYVASKAGLIALSANLARELGAFGIRSNAILPGIIDNPRGRALLDRFGADRGFGPDAAEKRFLQYVSMRTMIAPEEVAEMCVFLAGPGGRHVSGQAIGVCGNMEWEA